MSGDSTARAIAGLAHYRDPTPEEIQRGIDAAMREVCARDARYSPNATTGDGIVTVQSGMKVTPGQALAPNEPWRPGFKLDVPKETPGGQRTQEMIGRLCDAHLGPAVPIEAQIAALSLATVEEMLTLLAKRPQSKATATLGAMLEERRAQLKAREAMLHHDHP